MKKLTLSADEQVIKTAKRLAKENGTSVSAMFARLIDGLADRRDRTRGIPTGPIAAKASGVIRLPDGKTDREVLEDALLERYDLNE
ncbi:MAG: DUF6364 family protein [Planctomycetota bacterium]